jgi:hypothetical protein
MPRCRKNIVTTEPWPHLRRGQLYEVRIRSAARDKATGLLHVAIENLDPTQPGWLNEVRLPLPIRPGNRRFAFLTACGIDATAAGTTVDLDRLANVVIGIGPRTSSTNDCQEYDFGRTPCPPGAETMVPAIKSVAIAESGKDDTLADSEIPF